MYQLFLCLFLFPLIVFAKTTICLNMIVKDEKDVIRRCLDSVKPHIDYWVIVDTGSTDGTQEIIKEHMKDIPGILYERPWRNFGENRSEAFLLAQDHGDYILFIDADDTLEFEAGAQFPNLTFDLYNMWRGSKNFAYRKPQLVKASLPWEWVGVTHEYINCKLPYYSSDTLSGVRYMSGSGGATRKDPEKFLKNIRLLEEGLSKEPKNCRYAFYLAESYYDAGEKGKALEAYQKRVQMGGWSEEVYWSKLRMAHILNNMNLPSDIVIAAYSNAHAYRPHRIEAPYYLASYYNSQNNYTKAYELIKAYSHVLKPPVMDSLFNEMWIEDYGMLFQLSICAYYTGHYEESLDACDKLLKNDNMPNSWRVQTKINRTYPLAALESIKSPHLASNKTIEH